MTQLEIIFILILSISIFINVGLMLYARGTIVRLLSISEELGDLQNMVDGFADHLKAVYEMETFYGDQTLSALLEHAVSFNEQLETFEYIYSLTEIEEETQFDDPDRDYTTEEEAPPPDAPLLGQ